MSDTYKKHFIIAFIGSGTATASPRVGESKRERQFELIFFELAGGQMMRRDGVRTGGAWLQATEIDVGCYVNGG